MGLWRGDLGATFPRLVLRSERRHVSVATLKRPPQKKLDGAPSGRQPYEAMLAEPITSAEFVSSSSRVVVVGLLSVLGLISLGAAAD
jgi:hypothetical protein